MTLIESSQQLATNVISEFFADKAARLGAALAFYTAFSVAPLLFLSAAVATLFFGDDAVAGHLKHELLDILGPDGAETVQEMVSAVARSKHATAASSILGALGLVIGATGVFVELKDSMNTIWGVEVRPELGWWGSIWDSTLAFMMVLAVAALLLISIVLTTFLTAFSHSLPTSLASAPWIDFFVSSVVVMLLFMLIFKYLPDAIVLWEDVWVGALFTAILFTIGKHVVAIYLTQLNTRSAYGAMGSIMIFLLWTYYSSQILFLGAEFTQVFARMRGRCIQPSPNARIITRDRNLPDPMNT